MIIRLVGSQENTQKLFQATSESLEELGLADAVEIHITEEESYKKDLGITQDPALCIEEESINFKDMIFEGVVPEKQELSSMFLSMFGGEEASGCGSGGCDTCETGCASKC